MDMWWEHQCLVSICRHGSMESLELLVWLLLLANGVMSRLWWGRVVLFDGCWCVVVVSCINCIP